MFCCQRTKWLGWIWDPTLARLKILGLGSTLKLMMGFVWSCEKYWDGTSTTPTNMMMVDLTRALNAKITVPVLCKLQLIWVGLSHFGQGIDPAVMDPTWTRFEAGLRQWVAIPGPTCRPNPTDTVLAWPFLFFRFPTCKMTCWLSHDQIQPT